MKKHFLLLVMALMSLTGWAQTATLGDVGVGLYTYGDDDLPVPIVKDSEGAILNTTDHYTVSTAAYDKTTDAAVNKQDMIGGQELYLKITGKGAYVGQEKKAYFTVQKKTLNITITTANLLKRGYGITVEPVITSADWAAGAGELESAAPYSDTYAELGTLTYTYAGYGNPDCAGGEYDITFSGLSSDCYDIKYPEMKFAVVGTDLSGETVNVKAGTAFANKTYKGAAYVASDLTGLKLTWGTKELTQGTDFDIFLNDGYSLTLDGAIVDGKTYYTREGVVYTAVATPVVGEIGTYYELDPDAYVDAQVWNYDVKFKGNYSGSKANVGTFTIDQAPITVGMEDYEVTYDGTDYGPDPGTDANFATLVTFTYMGLVGKDVANYETIVGAFTTEPTSVKVGSTAKDAGDYELTISGGTAGGNYVFNTYLKGKLTINPIELAIKAKPANKSVGEADPTFEIATATPTGIIAGFEVSGVTFTRDKAGTTEGEDVGSYDITPVFTDAKVTKTVGTITTDDTKNYTFTAATPKAQFTIGKGNIVVTFKNTSKFYGETDPEFGTSSYVVTGLLDDDALPAFTITREKAGTADGEKVGYYSISAAITNPDAEKYSSLTVVPGALQIKKAQLTFTMPTQNVAKGVDKTALKKDAITVDGIKNSDVAADLYTLDFHGVSLSSGKTNADETVADGIYAILTDAADDNYEVIGTNKVNATTASGKIIVGDGTDLGATLDFVTAADATDYNNIKAHAGEKQDVTITLNNRVTRQVPAGTVHPWAAETWNTMVLPFEVTVAELSAQLSSNPGVKAGYAIVNVVDPSKTTEGNVQFKLEMQKVPANTPFCVKTSEAIPNGAKLTFLDKLIVDGGENPSVDAGMGYKFVGAYKNKTIDKNTPTYNFLRGDNNKWAHIGATSANTWTVVPFDAYVELTPAAAARGVTFTFQELDGSFTAIKAIAADVNDESTAKTGWYTIGGMKLQSAPVKKGLYIHNGKKVIIK